MTATPQPYSDSLGAALSRQKWVVLFTVLLTVAGAGGVKFLLPPVYVAQARLMVESGQFNSPALRSEAEVLRGGALVERVITSLGLQKDPELTGMASSGGKFLSLSVKTEAIPAIVLEEFRRRLGVEPITGSFVLQISYLSRDADKAARIVNTLAELYVAQAGATHSAEIERLSARLNEAEAALSQAQAAAPAADLVQKRAALEAQREELSKRYGPRHPRMQDLLRQIEALGPVSTIPAPPAVDLAALNRSVSETRQALQKLKGRTAAQGEPARIVSAATVPASPLHRMPSWGYGVAAFVGVLLGLLLAVINEKLDRRIGTLRNFEALTGQPSLGPVPLRDGKGIAAANYVLQKPASPAAESIRSLRAGLKLLGEREGRPLKVVTITSAQDDEDRALLAIWLARLAARGDEKVLLIDADLRKPGIHALLSASNTPSLVDYLTGQTHLEQIVWKKDTSGMHVIFASAVPNSAPDLIGSVKMTKLMGYLRQGYDLVVVCAPGCLAAADASLLANESDHTIFVADARATDRSALLRGLRLFSGFGYTSLSRVLTDRRLQV